jgi:TPR repeat protein
MDSQNPIKNIIDRIYEQVDKLYTDEESRSIHRNHMIIRVLKNEQCIKSLEAGINYNLGVFYENGDGVPQDDKKAVEWYTKAADAGHDDAQNSLGVCYEFGKGVTQDYKKAVEWYTKAADTGHSGAQYSLGYCYDIGQGVTQDCKKAVELYTKAAKSGNTQAQYTLGLFYESKAIKWFTKAAESGNLEAQFILKCSTYKKNEQESESKNMEDKKEVREYPVLYETSCGNENWTDVV